MRRSAVRPLSVEVVEFSPALVPEQNLLSGWKTMSSGAGGVIPTVVAKPHVLTAAGVTFTAVAEVHVKEEGQIISPSQWAARSVQYRS